MMICMFWKRVFVISFMVVFVLNIVFEGMNVFCVIWSDVDVFFNFDVVKCSCVGCV